jgi:hypothetical protein
VSTQDDQMVGDEDAYLYKVTVGAQPPSNEFVSFKTYVMLQQWEAHGHTDESGPTM